MRWIRLLLALTRAVFKPKIRPNDATVLGFRVWLTDVDVSVVNHAAIMTIFEMGRADYMVRLNFFQAASRHKWFVPNLAINVQFHRPLRVWQKGEVHTKISFVDDTHFYVEQKIMRKGKLIATCFSDTLAKQGRKTVPTREIMDLIGVCPREVPTEPHDVIPLFKEQNALVTEKIFKTWEA